MLNGVIPFSIFLVIGILYSIGSSMEIVALLAALVLGGLAFSGSGIALSRYGKPTGILLLSVSAIAAILTDMSLRVSNVLSIGVFAFFAFMNMSSNALVSYSISRIFLKLRGKLPSLKHTFSIGLGSPAVFFILFFIYIILDYSYLPLIALCSEIVILAVSFFLILYSAGSGNMKVEAAQ